MKLCVILYLTWMDVPRSSEYIYFCSCKTPFQSIRWHCKYPFSEAIVSTSRTFIVIRGSLLAEAHVLPIDHNPIN